MYKQKQTVRRSGREVIFKVYRRCLAEYEAQRVLTDINYVYQRTADMTCKSVSTVRKIVLEGYRKKGKFFTSSKEKTGRPKKELNDFDTCAIRQKFQFFYTTKNEVPTLRNLLPVLKQDLGFDGCRDHLRKVLIALGFKNKNFQSKKTAFMEKQCIAAERADYLQIITDNRQLKKNIVYVDESYIHQSYKLKKCWQSIYVGGVKHDITKGRHIIILAGSEKGFIPNALQIFSESNKNEINKINFKKWVECNLIPNIPAASVVVMDKAPYHSVVLNKAPTSASKIVDIKQWLKKHNIPFDRKLKKPQLLMLVKRNKPEPKFEIDELLQEHGHTVMRLPSYHCDLNPVELIWEIAKQKLMSQNLESHDIKEAANHAFKEITSDDWRNSCQRVINIENEYFKRELTLYDDIERLITNYQGDSSSTESDSENDVDDVTAASMLDMDVEGVCELDFLEEDILD